MCLVIPEDDLTTGELKRRLVELDRKFDSLDDKLDHLPERMHALYVPREVYETEQRAIRAQLSALEAWQTWALRLVVGAVISAILAVVLVVTR